MTDNAYAWLSMIDKKDEAELRQRREASKAEAELKKQAEDNTLLYRAAKFLGLVFAETIKRIFS